MKHFSQCELQKGNIKQIAWIPSEFAKVGKIIKLYDDNGWKVNTIGPLTDYNLIKDKKVWGLNLPKSQRTER